ncbi:ABC transporter [Cellulomonas flavigena]|uniref:ABC transporter n=1 Tax=Cellulomonas flavigena TaxID=1711 RepID=UPI0009E65CA4|nr:ABC transporter [Cellulomonas flavigena]
MGRESLRVVEYSAPESRVPASEETRRELSPYCLHVDSRPRLYPDTSQTVRPHLPPIEPMPVPVTPFPRLYGDDPEPA